MDELIKAYIQSEKDRHHKTLTEEQARKQLEERFEKDVDTITESSNAGTVAKALTDALTISSTGFDNMYQCHLVQLVIERLTE